MDPRLLTCGMPAAEWPSMLLGSSVHVAGCSTGCAMSGGRQVGASTATSRDLMCPSFLKRLHGNGSATRVHVLARWHDPFLLLRRNSGSNPSWDDLSSQFPTTAFSGTYNHQRFSRRPSTKRITDGVDQSAAPTCWAASVPDGSKRNAAGIDCCIDGGMPASSIV